MGTRAGLEVSDCWESNHVSTAVLQRITVRQAGLQCENCDGVTNSAVWWDTNRIVLAETCLQWCSCYHYRLLRPGLGYSLHTA
jgi:hypothetical protein